MPHPAAEDRIPVAAARAAYTRTRAADRASSDRQDAASATTAGVTFLFIVAAFAAVGVLLGRSFGAAAAGGIVGGLVFGVSAGFTALYLRYRTL